MDLSPNQKPADPGAHAIGCTGFGCLFCTDIDGCFPGPAFVTSQDVLEGTPVRLDDDDHEPMLSLFRHGEHHDTGNTTDHGVGIPYAPPQLPGNSSSYCDLPSNYSWGLAV